MWASLAAEQSQRQRYIIIDKFISLVGGKSIELSYYNGLRGIEALKMVFLALFNEFLQERRRADCPRSFRGNMKDTIHGMHDTTEAESYY